MATLTPIRFSELPIADPITGLEDIHVLQSGTNKLSTSETVKAWIEEGLGVGVFAKSDAEIVSFTKTGNGTATTSQKLWVEVGGKILEINASTAITMPTFTAGTDYAVWVKTDGSLEATSNFSSPPETGARSIGGFHYAPGGNATAQSGGDTTAQINQYSFWDLKWRPMSQDPRGMTLVAGGFWSDIYLLGVDHYTNGTSKYNVTIADGAAPPKIPAAFGGNGSTAYANGNWWTMAEVGKAYGKRLPTYSEFSALAYGTTEASSGGTDPVSTILRQAYTSKWGVMLSTGNMWHWGDEFGGPYLGASWVANTGGRGSTYNLSNAVLLGGNWGDGAPSGSRTSNWSNSPTYSGSNIGGRLVCDHLKIY